MAIRTRGASPHIVAASNDGARIGLRSRSARAHLYVVRACIISAVILGVFFRFYHIDRKVYWEDETYTSLHVLGVTEAEVVKHAAQYVDATALRAVLHPGRPLTTTVRDTLHSLAVEDPQHPPLYYIAGHVWVTFFGDSVRSIRTLSAIIGVAALPCMYWLCIELFGSQLAAAIGVGLVAISPIAVLFSQEAREYILWTAAIILMSATFLRALRATSIAAWALYAAAFTASLYTFPLSGTLAIGNVVVAMLLAPGKLRLRSAVGPVAACVAGCAAFFPWMSIIFGSVHKIDHAMGLTSAVHNSKLDVFKNVNELFKLDFFDFEIGSRHLLDALLSLPVIALIGYALYHLIRTAPRRTSLFIVITALSAAAPLVLLDLLLGQHFSENPRYFMPLYIALDLALVYLFATGVTSSSLRRKQGWMWTLIFVAVVAGRSASCAVSADAQTWWNKFGERSIDVARAINQADRPLLLSSEYMERPLSLSNYLDPKVAIQLRPRCYLCSIDARPTFDLGALRNPHRYSDVIVLGPSAELQRSVRTAIRTSGGRPIYQCIYDKLDASGDCPTGNLRLWPQ